MKRFTIAFTNESVTDQWIDSEMYKLDLALGNGFDLNDLDVVLNLALNLGREFNSNPIVKIYNTFDCGSIDVDDLVSKYEVAR